MSERYDFVFHRPEALDYVFQNFFGDKLFSLYPSGVKYTIIDDNISPDGCFANLLAPRAPIPLHAMPQLENCLIYGYGGEVGREGMIWLSCAYYAPETKWGVYYDPEECFIAMPVKDFNTTDKFISALIVSVNSLFVHGPPGTEWPDFFNPVFAPLGSVSRTGDKWHWENPFVEVVRVK